MAFRLHVLKQLVHLLLLLPGEPLGLGTEQFALELGNLGAGSGEFLVVGLQERLHTLQQLPQRGAFPFPRGLPLLPLGHLHFQLFVFRPQFVVAHRQSSWRKRRRNGYR